MQFVNARFLKILVDIAADLALAPACLRCRVAPMGSHDLCTAGLCSDCVASLELLDPLGAQCCRCGRPNPVSYQNATCPECVRRPPAFRSARSAARYGGTVRELLFAYKFRRDKILSVTLVDLLYHAAVRPGRRFDAVVPVPSHRARERLRKFAPVYSLGHELSEKMNAAFRPQWLDRVRAGAPQGASTTMSRRQNVAGAFATTGRRAFFAPRSPLGQSILIVDDVFTSGSTARECAAALRTAGARNVEVATIARGGLGRSSYLSNTSSNINHLPEFLNITI
ncbi:MAG: ComF family protein [Planctomycetota bacterium]